MLKECSEKRRNALDKEMKEDILNNIKYYYDRYYPEAERMYGNISECEMHSRISHLIYVGIFGLFYNPELGPTENEIYQAITERVLNIGSNSDNEKLIKLRRILKVFLENEDDIDFMIRSLERKGIKITWAELLDLVED